MSVSDRVSKLLEEGKSKEDIYITLLTDGEKVADIEKGFSSKQIESSSDETHAQQKTINMILTIAAILVGVGIFSFIASNWQDMSKTMKVLIIMLSMLISYWFGYYFYTIKGLKKIGGALFLLANLIFGAGIFLIGQIFNIRASWPDGIILWMLGVFAVSKATDLLNLYRLGILLGLISLLAYPFYNAVNFWNTGRTFLLTSSTLLLFSSAVCFFLGYSFWKMKKLNKN